MLGAAPGPHTIAGPPTGPVAVAGRALDELTWKRVLGTLG